MGGGDEGTRTPDLCDANAALSQLSYIPTVRRPVATLGRRSIPPAPAQRPSGRLVPGHRGVASASIAFARAHEEVTAMLRLVKLPFWLLMRLKVVIVSILAGVAVAFYLQLREQQQTLGRGARRPRPAPCRRRPRGGGRDRRDPHADGGRAALGRVAVARADGLRSRRLVQLRPPRHEGQQRRPRPARVPGPGRRRPRAHASGGRLRGPGRRFRAGARPVPRHTSSRTARWRHPGRRRRGGPDVGTRRCPAASTSLVPSAA